MQLKKYVAVATTASVACVVAAAGSAGAASATSSTHGTAAHVAKKQITIGFVVGLTSDPYFVTMYNGARAEAKKLGVTLLWSGSTTTYSPSAQIPYVNSVLAKHPSAFVLGATDAHALIPSVQKAVSMHIPVLTADSTVDAPRLLKSQIAGNNISGGQDAADLLAKAIGGKGQVAMLEGVPGIKPDENRASGFIAQLKKKYPHIQYVGAQFSNDQPTTAGTDIRQMLSRYPNLKGVFAIDDTTAEGTVSGLSAIGKLGSVKVVGYDAEPTSVGALKAGKLVGLIAQQPAYEGRLAVEYAVDAAEGKTKAIKKVVSLPNITITASNWKREKQYFYQTKS